MKLDLKDFAGVLLLSIILAGCGNSTAPLGIRRGHRTNGGPLKEKEDTVAIVPQNPEVPSPDYYICGVNSGGGCIWVMKNGAKIKEIPLAESSSASIEPDSHFLFSDSLYTTRTVKGRTSVALDGNRLFSFDASEYIISVLPSKDGVWTLGNDRDGDGFALRLDGVPKYTALSGQASELYVDQGVLCFSYRVQLADYSVMGIVRALSDTPIAPRFGGRVMDAAICGGKLYVVEEISRRYRLWTSESYVDFDPPSGFGSGGARLYRRSEESCALVVNLVGGATGMPLDMIVEGDEMLLRGGGSASYHLFSETECAHLAIDRYGEKLSVLWNSEETELPGMAITALRCAKIYGGALYLALSSVEDETTYVFCNGKKYGLKFNGTLTGIDVSPPS